MSNRCEWSSVLLPIQMLFYGEESNIETTVFLFCREIAFHGNILNDHVVDMSDRYEWSSVLLPQRDPSCVLRSWRQGPVFSTLGVYVYSPFWSQMPRRQLATWHLRSQRCIVRCTIAQQNKCCSHCLSSFQAGRDFAQCRVFFIKICPSLQQCYTVSTHSRVHVRTTTLIHLMVALLCTAHSRYNSWVNDCIPQS